MCSVPQIEVRTLEAEFSIDSCPCLPEPREMVELWQSGERKHQTLVMTVEKARARPELWLAIKDRYNLWIAPSAETTLLLESCLLK